LTDIYYLARGQEIQGPYSRVDLLALGERQQILESDLIRRQDIGKWVRATKVKGLKTVTSIATETQPDKNDVHEAPQSSPPISQQPPSDDEAGDDDELEMKGIGGKVLKYIACTVICIGLADALLYNSNLWDIYLGFFIGSSLETWTYWIAFGVAVVLLVLGSKDLNCPPGVIWSINVIAALALVSLIAANVNAMFSNPLVNNINLIRSSSLELCPSRTIDEMANSFFEDPQWSAYTKSKYDRKIPSAERGSFVVLTGNVMFDGRVQEADIRFKFTKWEKKGHARLRNLRFEYEFEFHQIDINGIVQPEHAGLELLELMCDTD
jgi:hypothetical protein